MCDKTMYPLNEEQKKMIRKALGLYHGEMIDYASRISGKGAIAPSGYEYSASDCHKAFEYAKRVKELQNLFS